MQQRLTAKAAAVLTVPPLLWAGNIVLGRVIADQISPMTLNLARWTLALLVLAPLGGWVLRRGSGLWTHWRGFAVLGLTGIGLYNSLQYLALQTSNPLNVSLVASSAPLFMLLVGRLFFHAVIRGRQIVGAMLSMTGVMVVLAQGRLAALAEVRLVPGDLFTMLAALAWAFYSWFLQRRAEPAAIRSAWAGYLLGQVVFGLGWGVLFTAAEWGTGAGTLQPGWGLAAALAYIAVGPAVLAFAAFGKGVQLAGPATAGFFSNLVPVFVAVLSVVVLGQLPAIYHAVAFALIVAGIVVSSGGGRASRGGVQ